jgi:outer membrane protein TolC
MRIHRQSWTVLSLGLLCSISMPGQQASAKPAERKAVRQTAGTSKLATLQMQRLALLKEIAQDYRKRFQTGQAGTEEVLRASLAVIRADLELKHTRTERIALRQQWVKETTDFEKLVEQQYKVGSVPHSAVDEAQVARLEAEINLERERSAPARP